MSLESRLQQFEKDVELLVHKRNAVRDRLEQQEIHAEKLQVQINEDTHRLKEMDATLDRLMMYRETMRKTLRAQKEEAF